MNSYKNKIDKYKKPFSYVMVSLLLVAGIFFVARSYIKDGGLDASISENVTKNIDNPCGLDEETSQQYNCGCLVPKCTEDDWTSKDGKCQEIGKLTKTWTKVGECYGGITHSEIETVDCEYVPPECKSKDWSYTDSECNADGTILRVWEKKTNCQGGVSHPEEESLPCPATTPECIEEDWIYEDGECQEDNTLERTWTLTKECEGGVSHLDNEVVVCVNNSEEELLSSQEIDSAQLQQGESDGQEDNVSDVSSDESQDDQALGQETDQQEESESGNNSDQDSDQEESSDETGAVKGTSLEKQVAASATAIGSCPSPCCPDEDYWWWLPLVIQALVLGCSVYLFKQVRYDFRLRYHEVVVLLAALVSQLCHWLLGCQCLESDWCPWYWLFNLIITAVFAGYAYYKYKKDDPKKNKNLAKDKKNETKVQDRVV